MNNWVLSLVKTSLWITFCWFLMRQIMKLGYQFIKHFTSMLIIEVSLFLNYYLFITDKSQSCISKMTWSHILFDTITNDKLINQTYLIILEPKKVHYWGDFRANTFLDMLFIWLLCFPSNSHSHPHHHYPLKRVDWD